MAYIEHVAHLVSRAGSSDRCTATCVTNASGEQLSKLLKHAQTAEDYDPVPADLVRIGFVPEGMEARSRASGLVTWRRG